MQLVHVEYYFCIEYDIMQMSVYLANRIMLRIVFSALFILNKYIFPVPYSSTIENGYTGCYHPQTLKERGVHMGDMYMELMDSVATVEKKILGMESLLSFMAMGMEVLHTNEENYEVKAVQAVHDMLRHLRKNEIVNLYEMIDSMK